MPSTNPSPKRAVKWCPHCQKYLPRNQFHKNRSKPDGLASYCKDGMRKAVDKSRLHFPLVDKESTDD